MEIPTTKLINPDGQAIVVNVSDVEDLVKKGWKQPAAPKVASPQGAGKGAQATGDAPV